MNILGLKTEGHDTGAALIKSNGDNLDVVAISEERLDRIKHSYAYPILSIGYCLDAFELELNDIDIICIDRHNGTFEDTTQKNRLCQFSLEEALAPPNARWGYDAKASWGYDARQSYMLERSMAFNSKTLIYFCSHVDCHAASSYYASDFNDSAVLVVDAGQGIYKGFNKTLSVIDRCGYKDPFYLNECIVANSHRIVRNSAIFFNLITEKLGFDVFGAGKTMALAAFIDKFQQKDYLKTYKKKYDDFLIDYENIYEHVKKNFSRFDETKDIIIDEFWVNIADEAQRSLIEDMLYLAKLAHKKTKSKRLCLAGGAALSCITNKNICDSGLFENLFIQPASSDAGIPLGAALIGYYKWGGGNLSYNMKTAYLGKKNIKSHVLKSLSKWDLSFKKTNDLEVARLISDGKIVARFIGKSEYGPRALGNRSILADPRRPDMLDYINKNIKHREKFRPFAPSCHEDKVTSYFNISINSPFMLMAANVKQGKEKIIPAVLHVDGSARIQTVSYDQNPEYYNLIDSFGSITGIYVLLNTSFNDNGEPIVETPEDAILTFLNTGIDYLYIEDWLVSRPKSPDIIAEKLNKTIINQKTKLFDDLLQRLCDMKRYNKFVDYFNQ